MGGTEYRCIATSVSGFVQQLAGSYLPEAHWFYTWGQIPVGKAPGSTDRKLRRKYGINGSRIARVMRRPVGIANVHYLRHQRRYLLLATEGHHPFYDDHGEDIRDVRNDAIQFAGYAIRVESDRSNGAAAVDDERRRVSVEIDQEHYQDLKAYFQDMATRCSAGQLADDLGNLPYEPYPGVRRQLTEVLRLINRARRFAGSEILRPEAVQFERQIVYPLSLVEEDAMLGGPQMCHQGGEYG